MALLEICCYDIGSCLIAAQHGAGRIELCAAPAEGGLTPSYGTVKYALASLNIPVYPIIRPRAGDFCYSQEEFRVILEDVESMRALGCKGIVTGILTRNGDVDTERMKLVKKAAGSMEITFHRAFDVCRDPYGQIPELIRIGITRILSSGQAPSAPKGNELLKELNTLFGNQIIIMPGAGIRSGNISELAAFTGCREFHTSASGLAKSNMLFRPRGIRMGSQESDEYAWVQVNGEEVKACTLALRSPGDLY